MLCQTCDNPADLGWTDGEEHDQCVYCACGLAKVRYAPLPHSEARRPWSVDDRRAYHRAYMQGWRERRKLALWREVLYGRS